MTLREVEQRLRAARPVHTPRDTRLSLTAEHTLSSIIGEEPIDASHRTQHAARTHRPSIAGARAVAVAVAILFVFALALVIVHPGTQRALATPQPLRVEAPKSDETVTLQEVIELRTHQSVHEQPREMHTREWALSMTDDLQDPSTIMPTLTTVTLTDDWQLHVVQTAGEPFDDSLATAPGYEPGALLRDELVDPVPAIPVDPALLPEYFEKEFNLPRDSHTSVYLSTIAYLLAHQLPTDEQGTAMLSFLVERRDLHYVGTTTDRLGRRGAVFQLPPDPVTGYEDSLILSYTTGHVLGYESVYRGGTPRTDITPGTVFGTITWEDPR